jgi:hypothetical protein
MRLDVICSDHLDQFFGFICDELADIGRRAGQHCSTKAGETRRKPSARIASTVELFTISAVLGGGEATLFVGACSGQAPVA